MWNLLCFTIPKWSTVEALWKGQECLTKVAKLVPFPCTILYNTCLFYPSWQATSFERPPSQVAFIEGFHCILYDTIIWCLLEAQEGALSHHEAYCQISNIRHTLVGNTFFLSLRCSWSITCHSQLNTWLQWIGQRQLQDKSRNIWVVGFCATYIRDLTVYHYIIVIIHCITPGIR